MIKEESIVLKVLWKMVEYDIVIIFGLLVLML